MASGGYADGMLRGNAAQNHKLAIQSIIRVH